MNLSINIHDFTIICRICLQNRNDMSILLTSEINCMLVACTSIQENYIDNKMPQQICNECYDELKDAYQFRQKYIQSTQILTELILKTEIQTENEEIDENFYKNDVEKEDNCKFETNYKQKFKLYVNEDNSEKSIDNFGDSKTHMDDYYSNEIIKSPVELNERTPHVKKNKIIKRNRSNKNKEHVCDICTKTFKKAKQLRVHKISHSNAQPHECSMCHAKFKYKWSIKRHMDLAHIDRNFRELCFICGKLILPNSYRSHLSIHERKTDEKYKCEFCERTYILEDFLRRHIQDKHCDTVKRQFHCDICNKVFDTNGYLKKHKTYTHSDERTLKCLYCVKSFKRKTEMTSHVNRIHKDLRPHTCPECNKAFHTKQLLRRHMVCHTGERPYSCKICGKSFNQKSTVYTHQRVHSK